MRWRRHSCLPPRHAGRGLALAKTPAGVETSLDAARKSACATKIVAAQADFSGLVQRTQMAGSQWSVSRKGSLLRAFGSSHRSI